MLRDCTITSGIERIAPARRPPGRPVGYQRWTDLMFVHWPVPVGCLQSLLPPQLTVDTWQDVAWVGLVPFHMSGVRPVWFPSLPGVSSFHETNVRTYVHREGRDPGVWFFSLDASNSLAVKVARWRWKLPYFRAEMQLHRDGQRVAYRSRRLGPGNSAAHVEMEADIGSPIPPANPGQPAGRAAPGTFEHFLAERYILYAAGPRGELYRGQVHHPPYPLHAARLLRMEESLVEACGIQRPQAPPHALYCPGVSVEIFSLNRIDGQ